MLNHPLQLVYLLLLRLDDGEKFFFLGFELCLLRLELILEGCYLLLEFLTMTDGDVIAVYPVKRTVTVIPQHSPNPARDVGVSDITRSQLSRSLDRQCDCDGYRLDI
ncbi:MAG: hypothetical protein ACJ0Q1_11125 [Luminiphilus sp.]